MTRRRGAGPDDERWMKRALALAARSRPSPNPAVGAVIVKGGRVVGEGFHHHAGDRHAEVAALEAAGPRARGATLYLTLEPCRHYGRTPPCTDAILASGLRRVVVGMIDPDPRVCSRGVQALEAAGIEVVVGPCETACRELLAAYVVHRTESRPFVTLKAAVTLDGQIATRTGDHQWVSGEASRKRVHRLRASHDAVLVGAGTVRTDDPELTVRLVRGRDPVRIVLDGRLTSSPKSRIFTARSKAAIWLVHTDASAARVRRFQQLPGVELLRVEGGKDGRIPLGALLPLLASRDIVSLLVEGGARIHWSFLHSGWVDRLELVIAPLLLGGRDGVPLFDGAGVDRLAQAWRLGSSRVRRCGEDLWLSGVPVRSDRGLR